MQNPLQQRFWESFSKSPVPMVGLTNSNLHSEPMHAKLDRDAHHQIWFFTTRTNRLVQGGQATAQFSSKGHDLFASLSGVIVEESDPGVWERHWSKEEKAWFPEGRRDPDAVMLRFDIDDAEVWTAEPGILGKFKLFSGLPVREEETGAHGVGQV